MAALRASLERLRTRVALVQGDRSTPETRLADNALEYNPASVASLLQLTAGALHIARPATSQARLALHGKATVFDRKTVAIGSFNLDPRSRNLNTEMVFIVRSPPLAAQVLDAFAPDFAPGNAWRIAAVAGDGVVAGDSVAWITEDPARPLVEPYDPASGWRRFLRSIERNLPIDDLL